MKKSECCPSCGEPLPTSRTISMPVHQASEEYKGVKIVMHRMRCKTCDKCKLEGSTELFIGETVWTNKKTGKHFATSSSDSCSL